jgi:DNA-binding NarL/FixJ family response regulator
VTAADPDLPATQTSADLPLRLAAVDDHPYVLKGILWTLRELAPWITVITTAGTVTGLLDSGGASADVVLLDLDLGVPETDEESDPSQNVRSILAAGPQVLILTAEVRPVPVRRAIAAGAVGLVLKSDPESQLIQAIRTARTGELAVSSRLAHALLTDATLVGHLAPREKQVFELPAQGVGRHDIGKLLDPPAAISTVDTYLKRAANTYRSLGRPTYNAYETLQHVIQDGHVDIPNRKPVGDNRTGDVQRDHPE